jgi:hypothetical protein
MCALGLCRRQPAADQVNRLLDREAVREHDASPHENPAFRQGGCRDAVLDLDLPDARSDEQQPFTAVSFV